MKILIISNEYPPIGGGAGNACLYLSKAFVKLGHQVSVVTSKYGDQKPQEIHEGIEMIRVPDVRSHKHKSGVRDLFRFARLGTSAALTHAVKLRPDVVLAFFGIPGGLIAQNIKNRFDPPMPFIVSLRGGDVPGFRRYNFWLAHWLGGPKLKTIWRDADSIVANSEGLRKLAYNFSKEKVIGVIENGVDSEFFRPAKRNWEGTNIFTVGRVTYQKGFDLLLMALAELKDQPWDLSIAGEGSEYNKLMRQAKFLGIFERIRARGWQEDKGDLLMSYQKANLFVLPSRDEGMSNAVLEAMACGLPVICSDVPGSTELIENYKNGLVFRRGDSAGLRDALRYFLVNPSKKNKMGELGRLKAETLTWEKAAQKYLEIMLAIRRQAD